MELVNNNNNNNNNNNLSFCVRLQVRKTSFALRHAKFTSEQILRETLNNEGEGFAYSCNKGP